MNTNDFNKVVEDQLKWCTDILVKKNKEYGTINHGKQTSEDDRLYNFKRGASLTGWSNREVLLGYMTKHLISILDLIEGKLANTKELRDEKIGDTINYLLLLKGMLIEEEEEAEAKKTKAAEEECSCGVDDCVMPPPKVVGTIKGVYVPKEPEPGKPTYTSEKELIEKNVPVTSRFEVRLAASTEAEDLSKLKEAEDLAMEYKYGPQTRKNKDIPGEGPHADIRLEGQFDNEHIYGWKHPKKSNKNLIEYQIKEIDIYGAQDIKSNVIRLECKIDVQQLVDDIKPDVLKIAYSFPGDSSIIDNDDFFDYKTRIIDPDTNKLTKDTFVLAMIKNRGEGYLRLFNNAVVSFVPGYYEENGSDIMWDVKRTRNVIIHVESLDEFYARPMEKWPRVIKIANSNLVLYLN